ncbi:DUF202 domain-containing protein [Rhodococcus sp. HM1]|uniref:DUF202 domain-containing protein n=1 Tax=unclassified Rhodococcus (in: high G+C Gram-positive bacteria) TaxID=192944 RepID=UPI0018CCC9C8|nr:MULTISPECIES: DUF202 domain-containing protein [unclassified Rhodococcus (in: high G+C Gram-positive bacteria)]MBH0120161.1 DUF202 domain-containing protein [Rhodococcus sp. CX]MCK8673273.1 DUF202 domain-containing protein [Rhodococcus sp. HM1]
MIDSSSRDPALQAERTALSWRRTSFSALCVTVLLLHEPAERGGGTAVAVLASALMTMLVCVVGWRRDRTLGNEDALHNGIEGLGMVPVASVSVAIVLGGVAAAIADY